ncbi:hypothetical protein NX722_28505 [Endozoicomonas gorgoniicola]|uniref:Uncharacterized protein n=1 Tax=Endozoicomonas gorgoniicola TaxID=1234144 RepID=A0ABT3N4G7_9GAMM|nr:hypothetical protein [Endozoicomonas gorgoniicola]MCW7556509.1 hypothetical protein [Endozoicomonas gorgoniicola]
MSNSFTMTVSQSTTNPGDYFISMGEGEDEKLSQHLVHLRFTDLPMLDEDFLDEVVCDIAEKLAERNIEFRTCGSASAEPDRKAKKLTERIMKGLGMKPVKEKKRWL